MIVKNAFTILRFKIFDRTEIFNTLISKIPVPVFILKDKNRGVGFRLSYSDYEVIKN